MKIDELAKKVTAEMQELENLAEICGEWEIYVKLGRNNKKLLSILEEQRRFYEDLLKTRPVTACDENLKHSEFDEQTYIKRRLETMKKEIEELYFKKYKALDEGDTDKAQKLEDEINWYLIELTSERMEHEEDD